MRDSTQSFPAFAAHPWHGVSAETTEPDVFSAYIEIVPTDTVKYELDKASGHLKIDRPQRLSSLCPTLYGFIPQTYCGKRVAERCEERTKTTGMEGDGDPLDICVITEKTISHGGIFVRARPIGGFRMVDGKQADDKIIAVLEHDVVYGSLRDLAEAPEGLIERLRHYFLSYKHFPGGPAQPVTIAETYDRAEALETIARSREDYRVLVADAGKNQK